MARHLIFCSVAALLIQASLTIPCSTNVYNSQPLISNQVVTSQPCSRPVQTQLISQAPQFSQVISNQIPNQIISSNLISSSNQIPNPIISSNQFSSCNLPTIPISASPVVATTLIDNSVSNSLANALQLLIVSDLIENTLNARECGYGPSYIQSPVVESYTDYLPYEQFSPVTSQVNQVSQVSQVVDVAGPGVETYTSSSAVAETFYGSDSYGGYGGGYQEIISPVGQYSPCSADVIFPSSIPAQLVCNFGYAPTTVPVVSVAVEPLPANGCGCGCSCSPSYYY